ncbi:MAG: 6-phosphofructokinase [Clostridiales bacterium]|nr:6-phosphofructokinase [Clostridiales bacterium]
MVKRIAVLTSGGDAPGMNSAIRAVVRTAAFEGISCLGVKRGFVGLVNGDVMEMNPRSVDGINLKGGTMLYTARSPEFKTEEGLRKAAQTCKYLGIDGLVCIGGDGTFRGARDLSRYDVSTVAIPATIDNDIACTRYSIGFDTACNTAIEAIDKLRDTMQSHERCSVVEVMGRNSGSLAMYVGIACGASAILIPERETNFEELYERMRMARIQGRNHHIIIVAEGVGTANEVAQDIIEHTGVETRVTVLGHVQRGGSPTARDRVAATRMGVKAVNALLEGRTNRVICFKDKGIIDQDIIEALDMSHEFHQELYDVAIQVAR